ncbi:MAG: DUF190 domain-containing protein [Epsilonproteobacteria bacterium]|nr:DUF190 domain-containing protein [Campylobacterota bacterium]
MKRYLGHRKRLRIYIDSDDTFEGKALWQLIVEDAKAYGLAGATVYKAVAGIGAHSEFRSFNVWSLSQKLPVIIEIIDSEAKIRGFLAQLEPILTQALITLEDVEVLLYKHPKFSQ